MPIWFAESIGLIARPSSFFGDRGFDEPPLLSRRVTGGQVKVTFGVELALGVAHADLRVTPEVGGCV